MTPDGWKNLLLSDLATIVGGGTPSRRQPAYWDGEVPWATPTDVTGLSGRVISKTSSSITSQGLASSSATLLPPNSLLMTTRATIGACAVNRVSMATNQGFQNLVPKQNTCVEFLYYLIRYHKRRLERIAAGSTFLEVSKRAIRSFPITAPLLPEQRKIAAILSSVDDAIEKTQAVIDQVQVVKRGLMQELLTRGLPGRHARFKQTEIGEIPERWTLVPLSEAVYFQEGPGLRRWLFCDEGIPFMNVRYIKEDGFLDVADAKCIAEEKAFRSYRHFFLDANDTVLSSSATLGRMGVVREVDLPLMLNTGVIRFRTLDEDVCSTGYMRAFLSSDTFLSQILRESQGGTRQHFGPTHLRKVQMPLPPRSEQKPLASAVAIPGECARAEAAHLAQLLAVKSALMSVLLTGELRVTPDTEAA